MALGGGKVDEILAAVPLEEGGGEEASQKKDDELGLENAMADLSVAVKDNKPPEAARALRRAVQIVLMDME